MSRLFICEKPSQARDIGKVLGASRKGDGCLHGDGVIVTWAFGHLLEQAPPEAYDPALKRWSLDTLPIKPTHWKNTIRKDSAKQFKVIKALLKQCDEVVLSTDSDREGETIGRELLEECQYRGRVSRLWLSALDGESIRKGLANLKPGDSTWSLYQAGLGRSRADWLIGMNLSRAFTVLAQQQGHEGVLSVGRVQTPTLALVVRRDQEIAGFVPKPYWNVEAQLEAASTGSRFQAKWVPSVDAWIDEEGRCIDQSAAHDVAARGRGGRARVNKVETTRKRVNQPLVMDLSALQKICSKRFGLGVKQVLDLAQSLYEKHKATTYPRTDCQYLPISQLGEVNSVVTALLQSEQALAPVIERLDLSMQSQVWNDSKITAHHGIIPTTAPCKIDQMSENEYRVYDVIRRYFLAQFMPAHEYDQTKVWLDIEGEKFAASGRQVKVEGWKSLFAKEASPDDEEAPDARALPPLSEGVFCEVTELTVKDRETQPPKHYSQGDLIDAMKNPKALVSDPRLLARLKDNAGIGTNATRADVIETLLKRGFIRKQRRVLISTPLGQGLIAALPAQISNPGMTALWEQALDQVAEGAMTLDDFMSRQNVLLDKLIAIALQQPHLNLPEAPSEICDKCQSKMRKRNGANGQFWACTRYPDCNGTKPIEKKKATSRKTGTTKKVK